MPERRCKRSHMPVHSSWELRRLNDEPVRKPRPSSPTSTPTNAYPNQRPARLKVGGIQDGFFPREKNAGFLRYKNALVVQRIQSHQPSDLRVCTVTAAELYTGCLKSAKPVENRARVDSVLTPYMCLPFDLAPAEVFAQIPHHLKPP